MSARTAITAAIACMTLSFICSQPVPAQEAPQAEQPQVQVAIKQVSGVISGLSSGFIAIELGGGSAKGARESAFNLDKNVRIVHKKSLKELSVGDTVSLDYEETVTKQADGKKMRKTRVIAITFLKAAPQGLIAQEETQPLQKSEPKAGELSLKGIKGEAGNE
ncbi:MAG TPA: hypothetical protein P5110_03140 [Candidatus Omnitrophota bacterium]|nr:hypothetical protein [Candidatus Omnitrophota bacterium]HRZ14484.1 hypothetical protein [Candidatus Omnitrophota bacterium]